MTSSRGTRASAVIVVAILHVIVVLLLIRAFAPDFTAQVTRQVLDAVTVTVTTPTPTPTPSPSPSPRARAPEPEGAAAPEGKKAVPKAVTAPQPKILIAPSPAPKVASTGSANSAGARDTGDGTGAGGLGSGTGSGTAGSGQGGGGGAATKAVKVSGDINSARDYPRESRDARIGDSVTIVLTVGTDGRARNCRISRPSRDPEADRITCDLAMRRFRFDPARDRNGNAVESVYGWQQRWFYPGR